MKFFAFTSQVNLKNHKNGFDVMDQVRIRNAKNIKSTNKSTMLDETKEKLHLYTTFFTHNLVITKGN